MHRMMAAWPRAQLGQLKCILGLPHKGPRPPTGPISPPQKFVYIGVHRILGLFRHRHRRLVPNSKNIVRARKKLSVREGHFIDASSDTHSAMRHHDMACGIMIQSSRGELRVRSQSSAAFGATRRASSATVEFAAFRCYMVGSLVHFRRATSEFRHSSIF